MKVNPKDIEYRVVLKDYRTEKVNGVVTMYGSFYEVLNRASEVPHKHIISNEFDRVIEVYN